MARPTSTTATIAEPDAGLGLGLRHGNRQLAVEPSGGQPQPGHDPNLRRRDRTPGTVPPRTRDAAGLEAIRREHVETFLVGLQNAGSRPATVSLAYRCLQAFWKWAVSEDEVRDSPMAPMTPPIVPEEPPPILRPEEIRAILEACAGTDFEARRDTAIVRLLLDTGMRRGELAGLRLDDVDLNESVAIVMGKGRRPKACTFGSKSAPAIDRYLRTRASHPWAQRPELWLLG